MTLGSIAIALSYPVMIFAFVLFVRAERRRSDAEIRAGIERLGALFDEHLAAKTEP